MSVIMTRLVRRMSLTLRLNVPSSVAILILKFVLRRLKRTLLFPRRLVRLRVWFVLSRAMALSVTRLLLVFVIMIRLFARMLLLISLRSLSLVIRLMMRIRGVRRRIVMVTILMVVRVLKLLRSVRSFPIRRLLLRNRVRRLRMSLNSARLRFRSALRLLMFLRLLVISWRLRRPMRPWLLCWIRV